MRLILLVSLFAPFVELAARVAADPNTSLNSPVRLPIKKHIHANQPGSFKPAQRDLIRSRSLVRGVQQRDSSTSEGPSTVDLTLGYYAARIGVGNPPTFCESCPFLPGIALCMPILDDLLVDTGSSVTWVGGNKSYVVTNTSVETSNIVVSIALRIHSWPSSNQIP
jgi:hypothetical protein